MMKTIIICLIFIVIHYNAMAQMLSPVSINGMGSSLSAGGVTIEVNLGSLAVTTITTPTFMYTQGFIQPDAGTTAIVPFINDVSLGGGNFVIDAMGTTLQGIEGEVSSNVVFLDIALGEVASKTINLNNTMLTQGILQPYKGKYWTGIVSSDWQNPLNWSPAYVPTNVDTTIIPAMCPHYPIVTNGIVGYSKSLELMTGSSLMVDHGGMIHLQ